MFFTHSSAGLSLPEFFFFLFFFTVMRCHWREHETPVNSGSLIPLFFQPIWVFLNTEVWENASCMRSSSLQPASVSLKSADNEVHDSVSHLVLWGNSRDLSMVSLVPSSLLSAPLRLKQNYTFCLDNPSFDIVICPRQYRGTFAIAIPQNEWYRYIPNTCFFVC